MADKLRKTYPIQISFSTGEQPTAQKLTVLSTQARNALAIVEKAIGDLWNQSGDSVLSTNFPLQIPNLGRIIGENKYLNPVLFQLPNDFLFRDNVGSQYAGKTTGFLRFKPKAATTFTQQDGLSQFTTQVVSGHEVGQPDGGTNEFYIDEATGKFYIDSELTGTEVLEYTVSPGDDWAQGDELMPGVIPDPRQTEFTSCRVEKSGSTFYLHLPPRRPLSFTTTFTADTFGNLLARPDRYPLASEIGVATADESNEATVLVGGGAGSAGHTGYLFWQAADPTLALNDNHYRYQLPKAITDAFASLTIGSQYPEGLLFLWNKATNTVIEDVVFRKPTATYTTSPWVLEISSTTFDFDTLDTSTESQADYDSSSLVLITAGSSVSRTLNALRGAFHRHKHDNTGIHDAPISHNSLLDVNPPVATGNDHSARYPTYLNKWFASRWNADDHVSLLSRAGSQDTSARYRDPNNNAMLGHFILADSTADGNGVYLDSTPGESFKLYFGDIGGPNIYGMDEDVILDGRYTTISGNNGITNLSSDGSGLVVSGVTQTISTFQGSPGVAANVYIASADNESASLRLGELSGIAIQGVVAYIPSLSALKFQAATSLTDQWYLTSSHQWISGSLTDTPSPRASSVHLGVADQLGTDRPYDSPAVGVVDLTGGAGTESWLYMSASGLTPSIVTGGGATDLQVGFDNGTLGGPFTSTMMITETGVAIGSTSPDTALHVIRTTGTDTAVRLETGAATDECVVEFYNEDTPGSRSGFIGYTNGGLPAGGNDSLSIINETGNNEVVIGGDNTNRIIVDKDAITTSGPIITKSGAAFSVIQPFSMGQTYTLSPSATSVNMTGSAPNGINFTCPCPHAGTIKFLTIYGIENPTGTFVVTFYRMDMSATPPALTSTQASGAILCPAASGQVLFNITDTAITATDMCWINIGSFTGSTLLHGIGWNMSVDDASAWR